MSTHETFLEFVCVKLLGPASFKTESGTYWCCPFHKETHPSFHTLPHKPEYRDYWKCFPCGKGGDEFELIRGLRAKGHPLCGGGYERHTALLNDWREEFACLTANESTERNEDEVSSGPKVATTPTLLRKPLYKTAAIDLSSSVDALIVKQKRQAKKDAEAAWGNLKDGEHAVLLQGLEIAQRLQVDLTALANYCREFEDEFLEAEQRHFASCDDPDCNVDVCRVGRGLEALTPNEWEQVIEEQQREQEEEKRKFDEAVNKVFLPVGRNGKGRI